MQSTKLSVTCRGRLARKYSPQSLTAIDAAVRSWIAADQQRGIRTIHISVDDVAAMKKYGAPPVTGSVTALKVKKAIDALVARLAPDYVVLVGADDVVPMFRVTNPTYSDQGDSDAKVLTDNPYACSQAYSASRRSSYLIPDRVVGRIPDLPGVGDASWLVDVLNAAASARSRTVASYGKDLFLCCDAWKASGHECARMLSRSAGDVSISPPADDTSAAVRARHGALLHMIKCHGAPITAQFFGQRGSSYPVALSSPSIAHRIHQGAVVGAMCCYGADLFDPGDPAATVPGAPPIPSEYLRQGAHGFFGSTTIAWVGIDSMQCADWVVVTFLKSMLAGSSIGRAALEAKQDFVRWSQQQGATLGSAEEKTLLQFVLLGDPSIHPVATAGEAVASLTTASRAATSITAAVAVPASIVARKQRRAVRHEMGQILRGALPERTTLATSKIPPGVARALRASSRGSPRAGFRMRLASVQRVSHTFSQPEFAPRAATAAAGRGALAIAGPTVGLEVRQYSWTGKRRRAGFDEIQLVNVDADSHGRPLRTQVLFSC